MNGFSVPVSMVSSRGAGGALVATVIGLLVVLVIASRRDPTDPNRSIKR
ncbi:hypothetical protein [Curvibacter sp. PAE-UM]|nr:hypothetical protein [Curvibacter sp. PAE-UM]